MPRLHSWALTNLNLTGGYISAGVVPDVRQGREVPGGSQRPSSELGGDWLAPPNSTGLVRLEEEEAGLPRLSGASGGSEFRLGTSERSGIRSDKACTYHSAQFQIRLWPLGSITVLSPLPTPRLPLPPSSSTLPHDAVGSQPRHSFTTARATVIHCFASANTFSQSGLSCSPLRLSSDAIPTRKPP